MTDQTRLERVVAAIMAHKPIDGALVIAQAAIDAADEWEPIETAPKDKRILMYSLDFHEPMILEWDDDKQDWCETWEGEGEMAPSHWKPLPKPPEET